MQAGGLRRLDSLEHVQATIESTDDFYAHGRETRLQSISPSETLRPILISPHVYLLAVSFQ
jgi:hypothetical protein